MADEHTKDASGELPKQTKGRFKLIGQVVLAMKRFQGANRQAFTSIGHHDPRFLLSYDMRAPCLQRP